MNCYSIDTGLFKLDGGAMFGVVPKTLWNKLQPADENNLCTWAMRLLLIEENKRLILVDTGIGNKQDEKFFSHYHLHGEDTLDGSLARAGFRRSDITDVLLTHLHFDHVGGAVEKRSGQLVPAFPNALYWTNPVHWEHALHPNPREKASFLKENLLPLQEHGVLRFVESPSAAEENMPDIPFSEYIRLRFCSGHTEHMMLPFIDYGGKQLCYMADLLPSAAHFPLPWVMSYDIHPLNSMKEKESFLQEALARDYTLFFEHDPRHECCSVQLTEKGIRPGKFSSLEEWKTMA